MKEEVRIPGLPEAPGSGLTGPELEGLVETPDDREALGGVVVAHPHPLYGGTMVQPIVYHTARACRRAGLTTLRFNFRGVGGSGGRHEGFAERKDVQAAAAFLRGRLGPERPLFLAGYSFGAMMSALTVAEGESPAALVLIAFVVEWDEFVPGFFDGLRTYSGPVLAVCGERDELAPPDKVREFLQGLGLRLQTVVVPGADHYFVGGQNAVGDAVAAFLATEAAAIEGRAPRA